MWSHAYDYTEAPGMESIIQIFNPESCMESIK